MAIREVRRWLDTLPPDGCVGVDEGGLTLIALDPEGDPINPEAYLEVGGFGDDEEEAIAL